MENLTRFLACAIVVALVGIIAASIFSDSVYCEAHGGLLVRGPIGLVCIKAEVIRVAK